MRVSIARMLHWATLSAFASTGLMQAAEQATFHLPMEVHWGSAVLAPGDYSMSLPNVSLGQKTLRVAGGGRTTDQLPLVTNVENNNSNSSHLELWLINGNYFVREFSCGPAGKTFVFSVPKSSHRQQVAKS